MIGLSSFICNRTAVLLETSADLPETKTGYIPFGQERQWVSVSPAALSSNLLADPCSQRGSGAFLVAPDRHPHGSSHLLSLHYSQREFGFKDDFSSRGVATAMGL